MAYYHSTAIGGKSAQGCLEYSGNVARGGNQLGNEMIAERDTDGVVPKHTGDGAPCGKIAQKLIGRSIHRFIIVWSITV
jgi:hypothetical protein